MQFLIIASMLVHLSANGALAAAGSVSSNSPPHDLLLSDRLGRAVIVATNDVPQRLRPPAKVGLQRQVPGLLPGASLPPEVSGRLQDARTGAPPFQFFPAVPPQLMPYLGGLDEFGNTALQPGNLIDFVPPEAPIVGAKYWLSQHGLRYSLEQTYTYVNLTDVRQGDHQLDYYTFDLKTKWAVFDAPAVGTAGWISAQVEAKTGLGIGDEKQSAKSNLGTLTDPTGIWSSVNGVRLPEFAWQQSLLDGEVVAVAGMYRRLGHQVSALYGALSPEVRREQARRFRAGETQIVVATDVIGMGLNLPASHLYFWETRKFDGQLVRPLTATEIQQIAGRAGRGLGQDGYVGAFSSRELRDVRSRLPQHAPAVPLRFNVSPSLEHVEIIGRELGTTRISPVLHFFDQHVPFTDPSFKPQRSGGMHALAALADLLAPKLAISSKFSWVCLPLNAQEPVGALAFTTWLRLFRDGQTAHLDTIDAILKQAPAEPGFRGWQDHLERIEAKLKLLVAYQCLSWRFPDTFPERDQAAALREQLAGVLTDALSTLHSHDERVACAQCHRAMSFNSEFELCRECYRNQRQNNDPEEDPDYPDWS